MNTSDIERDTAECFARDVSGHVLTVLHDDGVYRHLRCSNPESSGYWFEVVTWPGSLAIRGDMDGGYVFSRVTDMFEFFRRNGNNEGINPGYWAEKLSHDVRTIVTKHSEKVLMATLESELTEFEKEYPERAEHHAAAKATFDRTPWREQYPMNRRGPHDPGELMTPDAVRKLIAEYEADDLLRFEEGARELLGELEKGGVLSDTWEWRLTDWDWSFLWNCHAIVWAIRQYDATNAVQATEAVTAR